jgi:hypothetical protein
LFSRGLYFSTSHPPEPKLPRTLLIHVALYCRKALGARASRCQGKLMHLEGENVVNFLVSVFIFKFDFTKNNNKDVEGGSWSELTFDV